MIVNVAYIRQDGCTGSTQFTGADANAHTAFAWLQRKVNEGLMGEDSVPVVVAVIAFKRGTTTRYIVNPVTGYIEEV